jgi:hypothetical protein
MYSCVGISVGKTELGIIDGEFAGMTEVIKCEGSEVGISEGGS